MSSVGTAKVTYTPPSAINETADTIPVAAKPAAPVQEPDELDLAKVGYLIMMALYGLTLLLLWWCEFHPMHNLHGWFLAIGAGLYGCGLIYSTSIDDDPRRQEVFSKNLPVAMLAGGICWILLVLLAVAESFSKSIFG